MKKIIFIAVVFALSGCVSTVAKSYMDKPIEEAYFEMGNPENIFDLSDGRKAFQYRVGGGSFALPGSSRSTVTGNSYAATVNTVYTPSQVIESKGCLITLIASKNDDGQWIVKDWRIPKGLVC